MQKLFKNDNSDSEEDLKINSDYANNYDSWRQKEELHKLKARYGEDAEILANSGEESSDTSEDDEGEEIPEEFEKSFYKTLACLKNKDPRIYNENVKFFEEADKKSVENETRSKEKKEKSLFLRDYERKMIVERGGKFSDSENEDEEKHDEHRNPTYVQEQQELRESFKNVLQDDDTQEDLLFKPKPRSKEAIRKEEEDYKEWLKGQKKDISKDEQTELKPLRDFWTDPNLDANEKFLRDYILNKKFLDKDSADTDLSYDHVVHDSDEDLSEDERHINQQEEFEHKYNFRFEEPDQEFIKRYPRTLENSLRRKDTRRAEKRVEVRARKETEKVKKQEELKQLKALKRKEIEEKIEKLKEITGNDDLQFNMMDLEGDFDPDEYDKKMSKLFNEEYYAGQEDEMKPEFPDIDAELCVESTWDNYDPNTEEIAQEDVPYHDVPHCEDPNFNMDAEYDGQRSLQDELVDSTKRRKKRRRSKFAEMISKEKPKFDPAQHHSYKDYFDQYYALDYEDMIGDLPCRFKYRQVVPNDYGLSVEEILMADDKELNKWCSLKRALEYKPDHKELNDVKMYRQKAANEGLKKKILKSLYSTPEEETEVPVASTSGTSQNSEQGSKKKRKRKRKAQVNGEVRVDEVKGGQVKKEIVESQKQTVDIGNSKKGKIKREKQSPTKKENNGDKLEKQSPVKDGSSNPEIKQASKKKRKFEEVSAAKGEPVEIEKKKKKKKKSQNNLQINESSVQAQSKSTVENQEPPSVKKHKRDEEQLEKEDRSAFPKREKQKHKNTNKKNMDKSKTTLSKKEKRKLLFKKSKGNKGKPKEADQISSLSAERLKAYGLNPKKFKNKLKYTKK